MAIITVASSDAESPSASTSTARGSVVVPVMAPVVIPGPGLVPTGVDVGGSVVLTLGLDVGAVVAGAGVGALVGGCRVGVGVGYAPHNAAALLVLRGGSPTIPGT